MAVVLILEPIFEADFCECSYGFRPGRKAHDALESIRENLKAGRTQVYDADLKAYFDSIPHDKLMACVRMRVSDRNVLGLIRMWLRAPIIEEDEQGKREPPKKNGQGTPPHPATGRPPYSSSLWVLGPLRENLFFLCASALGVSPPRRC
ncbi:MAG TPA: reverse transcriptase domain-containing protein [Opitutales bacterium]|nr:reverse transcriptase domain-containing protein [Opitutales bacterium]